MPGVLQHTRDSARKAAAEAVAAGVGGIVLFGIPAVKDARGSAADAPDGIVQLALADLAADVGADTARSTTTRPWSGTRRSRWPRRRRARPWWRQAA